jgi:hypothetical protein
VRMPMRIFAQQCAPQNLTSPTFKVNAMLSFCKITEKPQVR